jgi:4'-phosphopantetheinyl transferase
MELEIIRSPELSRLCWTRIPSPLPDSLQREGMALLTKEEELRYNRFSCRPAAEMYLGARLFSRTILGDLLSCPPDRIKFSYGEGGKPYLTEERDLFFNISHTAGTIAFISSEEGETGVDVEEIKDRDCLSLARHFFSFKEIETLEKCDSAESLNELFFRIWTQKEAYLKGTGKGLSGGLKHYTVPCVSRKKNLDGFIIKNFQPFPPIMGAYALSSRS